MHQQDVIPASDSHDDGGAHLRPHFLAAVGALLADGCDTFHGGTTPAAILGVRIPIQQFRCLACRIVERSGQQCPRLPQSHGHHSLQVGGWGAQAVGHAGNAIDGGQFLTGSPILHGEWRLHHAWNPVAVPVMFQHQRVADEHKPVCLLLLHALSCKFAAKLGII